MILRKAFAVLYAVFFLAAPAFAVEVKGVKFPDKVEVNGQDLTFNGEGERTEYGFQVYIAALYLSRKAMMQQGLLLKTSLWTSSSRSLRAWSPRTT